MELDLKTSIEGQSGQLKRGLSFVDLWSIGVGALIGGGIFTVIAPAVAQAGPALFIAFIIAGIIAILSTMSNELCRTCIDLAVSRGIICLF